MATSLSTPKLGTTLSSSTTQTFLCTQKFSIPNRSPFAASPQSASSLLYCCYTSSFNLLSTKALGFLSDCSRNTVLKSPRFSTGAESTNGAEPHNCDFNLFTIGSGGVRASRFAASVAVCELPVATISCKTTGGVGGKKIVKTPSKTEHHLWNKRDSAASGQKALNLVRIVCSLPNEKEAVYGELDKWTAWESEFPVIAVAKALNILKQRKQWKRVIQVAKWMFAKGQGMTMGTFDTLLLAFDMDQRVDEAESFWNMILHTHERSISRRLFSRMISIYAHHSMPEKIIEVFADMEELGVKPDEDTVRKVARAFKIVGEIEKQQLVLTKYLSEWKYIHFKGERVRVRRTFRK